MAIYLREFATQAAYEAAQSSLMLPNVSLIDETNVVEYNPSSPEPPSDPRLIAVYNVTDTSEPTPLYCGSFEGFTSMEVDGVELSEATSTYSFDTTGEHTVKYTLSTQTLSNCFSIFCCYPGPINVIIPNSVTSIGDSAFYGCGVMTSVNIPSGVTSIGVDAFRDCMGLVSIDIPNGVTNIGDRAFTRCHTFTDVVIPSSVTSIGDLGFGRCSGLTSVTVEATTPPTLGENAFVKETGVVIDRKIYVPAESLEAYKAAEGWSTYAEDILPIQ